MRPVFCLLVAWFCCCFAFGVRLWHAERYAYTYAQVQLRITEAHLVNPIPGDGWRVFTASSPVDLDAVQNLRFARNSLLAEVRIFDCTLTYIFRSAQMHGLKSHSLPDVGARRRSAHVPPHGGERYAGPSRAELCQPFFAQRVFGTSCLLLRVVRRRGCHDFSLENLD